MSDKISVKSSSSSVVAVIASLMAVLLCCNEFVRIELILKEQNTRMNQLENKMTTTQNSKMAEHFEAGNRPEDHIERIVSKDKRDIFRTVNIAGKYLITIQGPPGPPGPPGHPGHPGLPGLPGYPGHPGNTGEEAKRGARGPMGKQGPRGIKGDPGQNGTPGPRGMPGPKGDRGPSLAAPSVMVSPPHLTVNESNSAILRCSASGYPRPVIGWCKVGSPLPTNRSIVDSSGKLEIQYATSGDSGIYQCEASSILGTTQTTTTLEVNFLPRLIMNRGPTYEKTGSNVTLPTCHVTGHPKPKVTWSKAVGVLPSSRTVITDGQLTLLQATPDDSGSYICKAENRLGSVVAGSVLVVVQLPVFIDKPPVSYAFTIGATVVLNCTAKGVVQPAISWRKENGVLPAGRYEVTSGALILRDARKTDSGVFVCIATSAGVSDIETKTLLTECRIDCSEIYKSGERRSGVYRVAPDCQGGIQVYCDMTIDGGGWTVFQRRQNGSVDFDRDWQQYKTGFGNLNGEFWLGNDYIHRLTARTASTLRVDLEDWDRTRKYAEYGSFSIADESDLYRLKVTSYSGTAGDSFTYHNNMAFTTKDRANAADDEVEDSSNCDVQWSGAWWFDNCRLHNSNLNGKYLGNTHGNEGVKWQGFHSDDLSMKFTEMKMRPQLTTDELY